MEAPLHLSISGQVDGMAVHYELVGEEGEEQLPQQGLSKDIKEWVKHCSHELTPREFKITVYMYIALLVYAVYVHVRTCMCMYCHMYVHTILYTFLE